MLPNALGTEDTSRSNKKPSHWGTFPVVDRHREERQEPKNKISSFFTEKERKEFKRVMK